MKDRQWKISVLITTFNEADQIVAALTSVRWADEILVVDSFSTDGTPDTVRQFPATLVQRPYAGPADQKNWGLDQLAHDWVLILDADEIVTPELDREIHDILSGSPAFDAYRIPRQNYFMGKRIRFSGWQNDSVIRLIRRDVCRYNDLQVHEEIDTRYIRVGKLAHPLMHYTYKNARHYLDKIVRYSEWSAMDMQKKGRSRVTWFPLVVKPLARFLKHFVLQLGFLDGKAGFTISALSAWSVFLRYYFLRSHPEKKANPETEKIIS